MIWGWLLFIFIIIFLILLAGFVTGQRTRMTDDSMNPGISEGDVLVMDRLSYKFSEPGRFDVIVFPFRYQTDTVFVRRVIGLPGETVQIEDGHIYINGILLDEHYGIGEEMQGGLAGEVITLSEDEYFVLADNRDSTPDSREPSVRNIKKDDIIGKAIFCIWPLQNIGLVR